jgi:hypothetical protein
LSGLPIAGHTRTDAELLASRTSAFGIVDVGALAVLKLIAC